MVSIRYKGCMDWMDNEEWYSFDEEKQRFFLTETAPEEARRSFELYMKANWKVYRDLGFDGGSND